jgi:hypothetical protein
MQEEYQEWQRVGLYRSPTCLHILKSGQRKNQQCAKPVTKSLISYDVAARPCESGPFCSTHAGRKGDAGKKYPFEVLRGLRSSVDDTKFGYDLTWSDCVCTPDEYSYGCHCKRLENYTITRGVITKDDLVEQCVGHISVENGYSPLSCYFVWRLARLVARDWHGEASEMIEPHLECDYYGEYFTGWQSFIADKIREKCNGGLSLSKLLLYEYGANPLNDRIEFDNVVQVDPATITIPHQDHFDRCVQADVYPEYVGIVAICTIEQNNHRLVLRDGYHRLASQMKRNVPSVLIIRAILQ